MPILTKKAIRSGRTDGRRTGPNYRKKCQYRKIKLIRIFVQNKNFLYTKCIILIHEYQLASFMTRDGLWLFWGSLQPTSQEK